MAGTSWAEIAVEKVQKEDVGPLPGKEEDLYSQNVSARSAFSYVRRTGKKVQQLCVSTQVRLFGKDKDSYPLSRVTGARLRSRCGTKMINDPFNAPPTARFPAKQ
jgi:hypothetical protein